MRIGLVGLALGYAMPAAAGTICAVPGDFERLQGAVDACAYGVIEVDANLYSPKVDFPGVVIKTDLTIVGVSGMADLPNLSLRGSHVVIDNVRFGEISDPEPFDTTLPELAAVTLVGGSLHLTNSKLASIEKAGVIAIGADVRLEGVDAQGYLFEPVLYVVDGEYGEPSSLTMIGGSYVATMGGVVVARNADIQIEATLFTDNAAETATVLYMENSERKQLTLTDVTILRSWSWADPLYTYGGAIVVSNTDVTMTRGEIRDADSYSMGSGISLLLSPDGTMSDDPPDFVATDVLWKNNHADAGAAGLLAEGYDVRVEGNSRFEYNSGSIAVGAGGAAFLSLGSALFQGTRFTGNASYAGGAVAVANGAVTFDQVELDGAGQHAADYGGLVYAYGSEVDFLGSRLTSVVANEQGGAVFAEVASTIRVEGGETIDTTSIGWGGFAYVVDGSFAASGVSSQAATAAAGGGFLYAVQAQVTVEDVTFHQAGADYYGGTLHIEDPPSAVVARSMFCNGSAWGGAAVELAGRPTRGDVVLENNVFAYNQGGASFKIFPGWGNGTGAVKLRNNDFVHNNVEADVRLVESGVDLRNLLFRGSSVAVDAQAAASGGYNLYDSVGTQVLGGGFDNPEALEGEALFVGGPPTWCDADLRPTWDSPVVDAGDPGMDAPWGEAIDIGVYEFMGDGEDTDVEDTDVDDEPDDTDDEAGLPAWVSGGGGCATAGGAGAGWLAAGLAALALRRRRSPVRSVRFG